MTVQKERFKGLDKSVRKKKIVETAITLFHKKGYRSTTLEDVAGELGLTKAAIYHYVSSKESLLSIIYMQAMDFYLKEIAHAKELQDPTLSPPEKFRFFIRSHIRRVAVENQAMLGVFLTEENQLPKEDFKKIRDAKRKYNLVLESILKQGMEEGFFRRSDPRLTANAVLGMCNSLHLWYRPKQGRESTESMIEEMVLMLERGILADEPGTNVSAEDFRVDPGQGVLLKDLRQKAEALIRSIDNLDKKAPRKCE